MVIFFIVFDSLALKICQNMSFKKIKIIKHVFLLLKNTHYSVLLIF
jgi:hypothetical protein